MIRDPAELREAELRLREELRKVRLVFELGFPDELVDLARDTVQEARTQGILVLSQRTQYPACWVMSAVSLARGYDGRAFWGNADVQNLFGRDPTDTAKITIRAFENLRIETFHQALRQENALINLSPVLMHAGIPAPNVLELVRLIAKATRNHRYGAEEQIAEWSRTPAGFGNLWRGSQLLFKYGGAIAVDLLDRFNDALLGGDAANAGLPTHLAEALENLDDEIRASGGTRTGFIRRPRVILDPWTCDGPAVCVPRVNPALASRWQISGAAMQVIAARDTEVYVPLTPQREWDIRALNDRQVVGHWSFTPHDVLPVMLFDGESGRLLEPSAGGRRADSGSVLALLHPQVDLKVGDRAPHDYPDLAGEWTNWQIIEIDIEQADELQFVETHGQKTTETIRLYRPPLPPHLKSAGVVPGVRTEDDCPVYNTAPTLFLEAPEVAREQISVDVCTPTGSRSAALIEIGSGPEYELNSLLDSSGSHAVSMEGPLGLRMRPTNFALLPEFEVTRSPAVATQQDDVGIALSWQNGTSDLTAPPQVNSVNVTITDVDLRIDIPRIAWGIRRPGEVAQELGPDPVLVTSDELADEGGLLFSVTIGSETYARLELRHGHDVLQILEPPRIAERWTTNLAALHDTVQEAPAEGLDLHLVIDQRSIAVGRVISEYIPTVSVRPVDPAIEPAVLELDITENRQFKGRVVRLWNLDHPYDPSIPIQVSNDERELLLIPLPAKHRSGTFRLWLRVEEPWATTPRIPHNDIPGVIDVFVPSGVPLDNDDPIDRITGHMLGDEGFHLDVEDIEQHGHVALALLSSQFRANGIPGLSSNRAARLLNALDLVPQGILNHLIRAIDDGLIDRKGALAVSLSVMPSILRHEHEIDLELDEAIAHTVWSVVPHLGAAIEFWSESPEALDRWSRFLGWPRLIDDDAEGGVPRTDPTPRPLQSPEFDQQVRLVLQNPEFGAALDQIGALGDQPLTQDGEFTAIFEVVTVAPSRQNEVSRWRDRYEQVVLSADRAIHHPRSRAWIDSYVVMNAIEGEPQYRWILADIACLAVDLIHSNGHHVEARDALLEATDFAPAWVGFCLLQVFADDLRRLAVDEEHPAP